MDTIPKNTVIQYVRHKGGKKKNVPYGVVVAVKNADTGFNVGYSLCNKKDKFCKAMALRIALGRTMMAQLADLPEVARRFGVESPGIAVGRTENHELPNEVRSMLPNFLSRCKKYYKVGL